MPVAAYIVAVSVGLLLVRKVPAGASRFLAALTLVSALGIVCAALPSSTGSAVTFSGRPVPAASAPSGTEPVDIRIRDGGFVPAKVTIEPGHGVHWTNDSSSTHTVTALDGTFDSGALAPGDGFTVGLSRPGIYRYRSSGSPSATGSVHVLVSELTGPDGAAARAHIPDLSFPPDRPREIGTHPVWGIRASRTRALVLFKPSATVAEANAALRAADVRILGGLPLFHTLIVEAPDTPDFSGLTSALESLRASPAIEAAALSPVVDVAAVPRPPADDFRVPSGSGVPWSLRPPSDLNLNTAAWGLNSSRFPQAWNLLEATQRKDPQIRTAVLDKGFGAHDDLRRRVVLRQFCSGGLCTDSLSRDHGNLVAGIIAAEYDNDDPAAPNRSLGISGANPVASVDAVSYAVRPDNRPYFSRRDEYTLAFHQQAWQTLLNGAPESVRVINVSLETAKFVTHPSSHPRPGQAVWWDTFNKPSAKVCGPAHNRWCTPNNEERYLKEFAAIGEMAREVAEQAAERNTLIVQAAGNDTELLCRHGPRGACAPHGGILATRTQSFAWASKHWRKRVPDDPVLVVEAVGPTIGPTSGPTFRLANFSNVTPDLRTAVSAPGVGIGTTAMGSSYESPNGTSFAAPFVAALAGYLLAYNPDLTIKEIKRLIREWGADTVRPAQKRLDAFATMLAVPGAARDLVDVNESEERSQDGNRRAILGRKPPDRTEEVYVGKDATSAAEPFKTSPDGLVDMRDFRRFRDAWLLTCAHTFGEAGEGCPSPSEVRLDGGPDHSKKDLNFDGCVSSDLRKDQEPPDRRRCPASEFENGRFDFNGDGQVAALGAETRRKMPLEVDGRPAATYVEGTWMSDLEVLQSQWERDTAKTEGWSKDDLPELAESGDLEVHADDFFDAGAKEVQVTTSVAGSEPPARKLRSGDALPIVVTVPNGDVEVRASAIVDGKQLVSHSVKLPLRPGEDRRADVCIARLELAATPPRLPNDGKAGAQVSAKLTTCGGQPVKGQEIKLSMTPHGRGHARLTPLVGSTDERGRLVADFTAGTKVQRYTVDATADLGEGEQAKARLVVPVERQRYLHYVWRQTNLDWLESGTTRWPAPSAAAPDCTFPDVVDYCVDSFTIRLSPGPASQLQRKGTLTGAGASFTLRESVGAGAGQSTRSFTLSDPGGGNPRSAREISAWKIFAEGREPYTGHQLPATVTISDGQDGVRLFGLAAVGKLGYRHSLEKTRIPTPTTVEHPVELHAVRPDLMLVPRDDGSAIRYAGELSQPVFFRRKSDGKLDGYRFCSQPIRRDLTTTPGYRIGAPDPWVPGATNLDRDRHYDPGDRPMPVGPGYLDVRYAFAAVLSDSPTRPASLAPPDCSTSQPPDADFGFKPSAPHEGRVVQSSDASTDPDNDIVSWRWDFGDGTPADTRRSPDHRFKDNGTHTMRLTVTDTGGKSDTTTRSVNVANLPPEASLDDAVGECGRPLELTLRMIDPGEVDNGRLRYRLRVADADVSETKEAGRYTAALTFADAGTHEATLFVTDKDGASDTAKATVTVRCQPPPRPEPTDSFPTCDPKVSLDSEEHAFLRLVNRYRAANGLEPVVASPALTRAAEAHVADMVARNFLDHAGSDGSDPPTRAARAGYPSRQVSENLAEALPSGLDVMVGWRSSPGHNANMLVPRWRAIGLARSPGSQAKWASSYGEVVDCGRPRRPRRPPAPPASPFGALPRRAAGTPASPPPLRATSDRQVTLPPRATGRATRASASRHKARAASGAPPAAAQRSRADSPAAPAFVISPARPDPRQNVSFVNRSRDGSGTPTEGSLVVVADNNPSNPNTFDDLAPGQRATVTGMPPGDWRVTMRAGTGASESSVTRNFKVSPDPTKLTFTGPTSGIAGTDVVLTARLNVVRTGDPAYDAWVDFHVGDLTAGGTTAVDGTAGARITLPKTPGTYPVRVSFAGDDKFGPAETTATVEVRPRPASAGTISTFAGAWTGPTPATSMGSTGTGQVPAAVAVHGKTVYVADAQANQIKAIDLERKVARLIAGNGTRGGSGDGGPARRAQLALPQDVGEGTGLAVDGAGNVYVSDTDNHRVRRVRPGGSITTVAGTGRPGFGGDGGPATDARLNRPRGLTFDAAGRLYIADSANKRIRRVDATGRISTLATLSRDPKGVAVRPNGNVLVAPGPSEEPFRWTNVLEVDPAGAVSKFVGGARAELQDPVALATDGAGNVYVTDTERDRIRVVDPSGSVRTWAGVVHFPPEPRHGKGWFDDPNGIAPGEGYASEAYLNHPAGVAFDAEGNGYIADRGNHRVRMVTPFGVISTIASGGSIIGSGGSCCVTEWLSARQAQLGRPGGLAVAPDGSVAIVDQDNFSLHIVDRGGWMRRLAGVDKREECQCQNGIFATNAEYAKFENVTSVAAEPGGRRFYFSEYASATDPPTTTDYEGYVHHVRFDQGAIIPVVRGVAGNLPPWYGGGGPATQESLFRPQGVALDPAGNLYIAETARHRVRKVSPDGTIATVAGQGTEGSGGDGGPATAAHLRFPEDVDVDAAGALYIADTGNHKVRKVAPDGRISTVAGTGRPGFDGDGGDAKDARLNEPSDLSVDADGSLYVTDRRNHRLRLITPRGTILTIAGTGLPGIGGQGGLPTGARLQAPDGVALDRAGGVLVSAGPRVWRLPAPAGPTVYASDVRVREGDSGSPKAKVTISLLESAGQATSVAFSTIAAAARAPADFAPKAGTVRFRPGELSTSLTLDVVGDLSPERNEGFEVRFSAPAGGAAIGDAAARVTIVDDD